MPPAPITLHADITEGALRLTGNSGRDALLDLADWQPYISTLAHANSVLNQPTAVDITFSSNGTQLGTSHLLLNKHADNSVSFTPNTQADMEDERSIPLSGMGALSYHDKDIKLSAGANLYALPSEALKGLPSQRLIAHIGDDSAGIKEENHRIIKAMVDLNITVLQLPNGNRIRRELDSPRVRLETASNLSLLRTHAIPIELLRLAPSPKQDDPIPRLRNALTAADFPRSSVDNIMRSIDGERWPVAPELRGSPVFTLNDIDHLTDAALMDVAHRLRYTRSYAFAEVYKNDIEIMPSQLHENLMHSNRTQAAEHIEGALLAVGEPYGETTRAMSESLALATDSEASGVFLIIGQVEKRRLQNLQRSNEPNRQL